ncbi:FliG C-terminal domain-containing protein [Bdellovibrionota bacterium FG-2]
MTPPNDPRGSHRGSKDKDIPVDGKAIAAELLNGLDEATRQRILGEMRKRDPAIASKVEGRMWNVEDLIHLDPKDINRLVTEVPSRKIALTLRKASDELKQHLFSNLPKRAGDLLREEILVMGPQRTSTVETAQREIYDFAKNKGWL